jgi:hypothetical protein
MGKSIIIFLVALLLVSPCLLLVPKAQSQTQDIQITKSWYIDSEGFLDVVGLVQNTGPNTILNVTLAGEVIGPQGTALSESGTVAWVSYLLPGQKAPFYMEFMQPQSGSQTATWAQAVQANAIDEISITPTIADPTTYYQYQGLKITSSKSSIGTTGGYNGAYGVSGVIENTGDQTATNLTVVGAFYNSTGNVVGVGYTDYLTPTELTPGNTTTFSIYALDLNQSQVPKSLQITGYQLLVQTQRPLLKGTAPIVTPAPTSTSAPTATEGTSSSPNSHEGVKLSSLLPIVVAVVIAVIIVAAAVSLVRQVMRRRPHTTVKEERRTKKQKG